MPGTHPNPTPCSAHIHNDRHAPVFLGPGGGADHMERVREARQKAFTSATPGFTITSGVHYEMVFAADFMRESTYFRDCYLEPEKSRENGMPTNLTLERPMSPFHLSKITDFLYSKDYAISAGEVQHYPTEFPGGETRCPFCNNLFRVLSLHLGIFHEARYLHMENLERLAALRFSQVLAQCPLTVLRMAVDAVYSVLPHVWEDQVEDVYSLAEIVDYRAYLVGDAVMKCVRLRMETLRVPMMDPILPFRSLVVKHPEFDRHMKELGYSMLARASAQ